MLAWLSANIGNIVVTLILLLILTAIVIKLIKDRKSGRTSCGCGCANCAMHGKCHAADKAKPDKPAHSRMTG